MRLVALLLLFLPFPALGEYGMFLHLHSVHPSTEKEINNNTPGFGVAMGERPYFLAVGGFKNSNEDNSFYLLGGARKQFFLKGYSVEPGLLVGPITGYNPSPLIAALPTLSIGKGDFFFTVSYAYKNYGKDSAITFHLEKWLK